MKVPISWLKEYVEINLPIEELAYKLTLAGLEVVSKLKRFVMSASLSPKRNSWKQRSVGFLGIRGKSWWEKFEK